MTIKTRLVKLEQSRPRQMMGKSLDWFYGNRTAPDVPFDPTLTLSKYYENLQNENGTSQKAR